MSNLKHHIFERYMNTEQDIFEEENFMSASQRRDTDLSIHLKPTKAELDDLKHIMQLIETSMIGYVKHSVSSKHTAFLTLRLKRLGYTVVNIGSHTTYHILYITW